MAQDYPFSGLDMMQNSMAQLTSELRNLSSVMGQSAGTLRNTISQQAAGIQVSANNFNSAALNGAAIAMSPMSSGGGGNFFKETFSSQFNKPSLWSRDIIGAMGWRQYDDMTSAEVSRYARHNLGQRAESLGMSALSGGSAAFSIASIFMKTNPYLMAASIPLDMTIGEMSKNVAQKHDWWAYMDKVGKNNALLGKGGVSGGWEDGMMSQASKWLSTQDKTWYSRGLDMKYEEMQSTIKSAEMQGYFFNTVDIEEYKRKTTKLIADTKEIMKIMKMTNDEAAAMIGEAAYFGYKDPARTIKQMNQTAAMTGLSFQEVKSYGMEYAKTNYAAFYTDKDVSTNLLNSILQKYDKKTMGGATAELAGITSATTNAANLIALMNIDPNTGLISSIDQDALTNLAGASPIELGNASSRKLALISRLSPGKQMIALNDINARGTSLLQSANPVDVQRFSLGQSLSAIKTILSTMDTGGEFQRAIETNGNDPFAFLKDISMPYKQQVASMLSQQNGLSMEENMKMLLSNSYGSDANNYRGPMSRDDISSPWKYNKGFLGTGLFKTMTYRGQKVGYGTNNQWTWQEALTGTVTGNGVSFSDPYGINSYDAFMARKKIGYKISDDKYSKLRYSATMDPISQAIFMAAMGDPNWDSIMSQTENAIKDQTGRSGEDSAYNDNAHNLIYSLASIGTGLGTFKAQRQIQDNLYSVYSNSMGMNAAFEKAKKESDVFVLQRAMMGESEISDSETGSKWRARYKRLVLDPKQPLWATSEKYMSGLSAEDRAYLMAMRSAGRTEDMSEKVYARAKATNQFSIYDWSPQLYRDHIAEFENTQDSRLTTYQLQMKEATQKVINRNLSGLDPGTRNKVDDMFERMVNTKSWSVYGNTARDLSTLLTKNNVSLPIAGVIMKRADMLNKRGFANPISDIGNLSYSSLFGKMESVDAISSSQYASLFNSGGVLSLINQMGDPTSNIGIMSRTEDGRKKIEDLMVQEGGNAARRAGMAFTQKDEQSFRELAKSTISGDKDQSKALAVEFNRQQNTVKSAIDTSNQYLQTMDNNMSNLNKFFADVSAGNAIRTTTKSFDKKAKNALATAGIDS